MKFLFKAFLLIIFINSLNCQSNTLIINPDLYNRLCGVWDITTTGNVEMKYSWGSATAVLNSSIIFDLGAKEPFIESGGMGRFKILKIDEIAENIISIKFLFSRNKANPFYYAIIHFNHDKTIWIEKNPLMWHTGQQYKLNRISKPPMKE
jgi:hypothetical protein